MLSIKKIVIALTKIDFLGMKISDGKYLLQPHVSPELHKILDILTSPNMIQQFLKLVNYIIDFLPKMASIVLYYCHVKKTSIIVRNPN